MPDRTCTYTFKVSLIIQRPSNRSVCERSRTTKTGTGDTQGREALRDTARDFGTAHFNVDGLHVKFELPKKVSWDQKKLKAIAERIVASGEAVESYLDVKLAVPESRFNNWPPALQQQFADARTVDAGKATFELSRDEGGV